MRNCLSYFMLNHWHLNMMGNIFKVTIQGCQENAFDKDIHVVSR